MGALRAVFLVVALLSLLVGSSALAAPVAPVDSSTHLWLAPYLDVFEDTSARLDLADVTSPSGAARFIPFAGRVGPNYQYTKSALWARVAFENTSDVPLERWLVVNASFVENIEVFREGELPATQGVMHPRAERELPRRSFSFRIALAPHQTRVVHVRSWGYAEVMLPLQLWEIGALGDADRKDATLTALCLGVMLAMALYNGFLFLFVRDRAHLYYAGYVVCLGLWCTCIDGSLLDVLPAGFQFTPHWLNLVTFFPGLMLASLFMRSILGLPAARPQLDRAVLVATGVMLVIPVAYFIGIVDYRMQNVLARPPVVALLLIQVAAAAIRWRDGLNRAAYVLFGWVTLVAIMLFMQAALLGIVPVLPPPLSLGYGLEAILFSLALAHASRERTRQVEERGREVGQLNEELRHQVAERSRELTEALARSEGTVSPAALEVGDLFDGRYRVLRPLGRGGMGAVYEVERARDARRLALKVVTATLSAKHAARFAREAEIGARLRHDHLVAIVDVGIAVGATPFLVMELVTGGSMEDQRKRFGDVRWARPILRQIARGLAELHANRIVHRDLKPGNVLLLDADGRSGAVAKISDFGISRFGALDDSDGVDAHGATLEAGADHDASPHGLTEPGAIMGTPLYMPPEALFEPARHPSADLFSFGVLAYEALTGRSPFSTPPVLLVRARKPIPEPASLDGVPGDLAAQVLACMKVEPSRRPTAKEIADRF